MEELREAKREMLRGHINARAAQPVHAAEILGIDARRRRYLTFPHDPARVWVEVTGTAENWRWGFYSSGSRLTKLVAALDGRGAGGGGDASEAALKRTLTERLPMLLEQALHARYLTVTLTERLPMLLEQA